MPSGAATSARYHGLDFLRASMMLMGVLLHAGVMYMPLPYGESVEGVLSDPRDPYRDIGAYTGVAQRTVLVVHLFRMPAFMLLAGFFASLLVQRRGGREFLKNRAGRIVAPLALFWLLLWPLDRLAWTFGAAMMRDGEAARTTLEHLTASVSSGRHGVARKSSSKRMYGRACTWTIKKASVMTTPSASCRVRRRCLSARTVVLVQSF